MESGAIEELIDELARVFSDAESAKVLLTRTAYPSQDIPDFRTPRGFWTQVLSAASDGKIIGGVQVLADTAAKLYPGNRNFSKHSAPVGQCEARVHSATRSQEQHRNDEKNAAVNGVFLSRSRGERLRLSLIGAMLMLGISAWIGWKIWMEKAGPLVPNVNVIASGASPPAGTIDNRRKKPERLAPTAQNPSIATEQKNAEETPGATDPKAAEPQRSPRIKRSRDKEWQKRPFTRKCRTGDGGLDWKHVNNGDSAFIQGDYEEAVRQYHAAYYFRPLDRRFSYSTLRLAQRTIRAYNLLRLEKGSRCRVMRREYGFVSEILDLINYSDCPTEYPHLVEELRIIRATLGEEISGKCHTDGPKGYPKGYPMGELTEPQLPSIQDKEVSRNWPGLGLSIGGGLAVGVGTGLMINWRMSRGQRPYSRQSEREAHRYLVSGSVVASVGGGAVVAGVVHMIRRRRNVKSTIGLLPRLGHDRAGLTIRGRF